MSHFVYAMQSTDRAPAGGGTTHDWFMYYKWDVADETYVPYLLPEGAMRPAEHDTIWFVEDQYPIGCAQVTKVVEDHLNDRHEIYYDTRELQDFHGQRTVKTAQPSGLVTSASSVAFFDELKKRMDVVYQPRSVLASQAVTKEVIAESAAK